MTNIDLLHDTLYNGLAGQMPDPYIHIETDQDSFVPDLSQQTKQSQPIFKINNTDPLPPEQVARWTESRVEATGIDIRPRFKDAKSGEAILLDTGAAASVCPPGPDDVLDPTIKLEAVDGSELPCYGTKTMSIQLNRKTS